MTYVYRCTRHGQADYRLPVGHQSPPPCRVCGGATTRVFTTPNIRMVGSDSGGGKSGAPLGERHTPERDRLHEAYVSGQSGYKPGELVF